MRTRSKMAQPVTAPATAFLVDVELFLVYVMASRDDGDWRDVVARSQEGGGANMMCNEQAGQLVRMARALQASARDLAISQGGSNRHASELLQRLVGHVLAELQLGDAETVIVGGDEFKMDGTRAIEEFAQRIQASSKGNESYARMDAHQVENGDGWNEASIDESSRSNDETRQYSRKVAELEMFIDEQRHAHARAIDKAHQDIVALDHLRVQASANAQRWKELYEDALKALDSRKTVIDRSDIPEESGQHEDDCCMEEPGQL